MMILKMVLVGMIMWAAVGIMTMMIADLGYGRSQEEMSSEEIAELDEKTCNLISAGSEFYNDTDMLTKVISGAIGGPIGLIIFIAGFIWGYFVEYKILKEKEEV